MVDFVYILGFVDIWFGENTFEVLHQEMFYFVLLSHSIALLVFQEEYFVFLTMVQHGFVEEFGFFVSLFEPLNSGFLLPQDFLLFSPFLELSDYSAFLLSQILTLTIRNDLLLDSFHSGLEFVLLLLDITKLFLIPLLDFYFDFFES